MVGLSIKKRILSRISVDVNGCWIWDGCKQDSKERYGRIRIGNRLWLTHRASYEAWIGAVPEGRELHHVCHNLHCVNPFHVVPVSHCVNTKDKLTPINNSSGAKGVSWHNGTRKWMAYITNDCKRIHLGYFESKEDAVAMREKAEREYFKLDSVVVVPAQMSALEWDTQVKTIEGEALKEDW